MKEKTRRKCSDRREAGQMWSRKVSLRSGYRGTFKALRMASDRSQIAFCLGVLVAVSSYSDT